MTTAYTIGIDYGTNSVRAVVVDCADGRERRHGRLRLPVRRPGRSCSTRAIRTSPGRTRPTTWTGLEAVGARRARGGRERARASRAPASSASASTRPARRRSRSTRRAGRSRSTRSAKANLAAHAWLWKDHTGGRGSGGDHRDGAPSTRPQYLAPIGGDYSSEWFWSKIWHCLQGRARRLRRRRTAGSSWPTSSPRCSPASTTRAQIQRGVCAAGHKAHVLRRLGRAADEGVPRALDPKLAALRDRLFDKAYAPTGRRAGCRRSGRSELGLPEGIPIAMGGFDAHYGAVGAGVATGHARQDHRHLAPATARSPRTRRRSPTSPASAGS